MSDQIPIFHEHRHPSEWTLDEKIEWARGIIAGAFDEYQPEGCYALVSGGDDSLICASVTAAILDDMDVPFHVGHFDTGIGLEETHRFVRGACGLLGWDLTELHAERDCGESYRRMVVQNGMPGSPSHRFYKDRLKMRCARELRYRVCGKGTSKKVLYFTGIRWEESDKRKEYTRTVVDVMENQVWVNPIYWFLRSDMKEYRRRVWLPRNPASELIGHSLECTCGANADGLELAMIRKYFPLHYLEIQEHAQAARDAGHDWGWGEGGPPKKHTPVGQFCIRYDDENDETRFPLCYGCGKAA